jgi:hypothetical protein
MNETALSIVISASNADYGGKFLERLQLCVDDKAAFCRLQNINTELIVVEWNPPQDRPALKDAIRWDVCPMKVKIITVSESLHRAYYNPGNFSFLEYMAKNVGIRRASGKMVLSTNADVLFSPQMELCLAAAWFHENSFYRANRHDLDRNGQIFQINYANGTFGPNEYPVGNSKTGVPYRENMPHFNASGDFMLMSRAHWHHLRAYPENTGYMITLDGEMVHIALKSGLQQVILPEPIYHQYHEHNPIRPWYMPPQGWHDSTPRGEINKSENWGLGNLELPTWEGTC